MKTHLRLQRYQRSYGRSYCGVTLILDGIFLVRFFHLRDTDHTICVDTILGLILDTHERYPLILTFKSLLLCSGGDHMRSRIVETWELADRPVPKNNGSKETKNLNKLLLILSTNIPPKNCRILDQ